MRRIDKPHSNIKCFIAMAIGKADSDAVYFEMIEPLLRKMNIIAIRVDRQQHKDDLNNAIIRMINDADIILADLTYARPSVYYEAGFAERQSPVVYTVRNDHLSRRQLDERFRVHFDLEMKKIISWESENDRSFIPRLRERISYLINPILVKKQNQSRIENSKQAFKSYSINDQHNIIIHQFVKLFRKKRLWFKPLSRINSLLQWNISPAEGIVAAKCEDRKAITVTLIVADKITKQTLKSVLQKAIYEPFVVRNESAELDEYEQYVIFTSLSRIPSSRLTEEYPDAIPSPNDDSYVIARHGAIIKVWMMGKVDSEIEAKDIAEWCMYGLKDTKSNKYTAAITSPYHRDGKIVFSRKKKQNEIK